MIIFAKIRISIDYKVFILLNVHPAKKQAAPFPKSAAPVYKTNLTNRRESLRGPCAKVRQFFSCAKRFKQKTPFLQS